MRGSIASCLAPVATAFVLASCIENPESQFGIPVRSPSGEYAVFATLSSADSSHDHNHVFIHLVDDEGNELSSIDSRASNVHKWALGWMRDTDVVVLASSDIGTRSFRVEGTELVDNGWPDAVRLRACELYQEKYESVDPHCR